MSRSISMASLGFYVLFVTFLMAISAEGAPNTDPKKVKCQDKSYPTCYHKNLYCPADCPRKCTVDCATCQPVCPALPPPPSPKPKTVRCHDKKYASCYNKKLSCPADCPRNCFADCATCKSSCTAPPVKPKKVKCQDRKTNPSCFHKQFFCPATCPKTCTVDCASCQPVCPALPPQPSSPPPPQPSSPPPPQPPSPPPPTPPKSAKCINRNYPQCYNMHQTCPSDCPDTCVVDCVSCKPVCDCNKPGAVCQDPRFVGGDGLTFYFHGKKDQDFCLVSDPNLHINAHFIGKRNENMTRDFTWVQSVGILFDTHQLYIGAKKTATWDDTVDRVSLSFDGEPVYLRENEGAQTLLSPGVSITRSRDTNALVIDVVDNFKIKAVVVPITEKDSRIHNYGVTKEDCLAHLDLSFKFYSLSGEVDGVLGQTYAAHYVSKIKMGISMPVLGGENKFSTSSLFAADCAVARFNGGHGRDHETLNNSFNHEDMNCASGMDGGGVVCKR